MGVFVLHLSLSVAALLGTAYFDLSRGQHGTAPVTALEMAMNAIALILTSPTVVIWWLGKRAGAWLLIAVVIVNSALWAWALERTTRRRAR